MSKKTGNSETTKVDTTDYLTEDPTISSQKYMCVSFLKPSQIEEKYRSKDLTVCGFKVRGCYESYEEAKARADYLQKMDQYHNIYIAEVGKWCPFEDNPEKAKDNEYMNKDLNKLMKSYWKQQADAKEYHELRKQDMVKKAMDDVDKRKKENDAKLEEESTQDDSTNLDSTSKKKKNKKVVKVDELKSELDTDKKDLEVEKKEVDESINTLRRLEDELSQKIKEMEAEAKLNK